MTTCMPRSAPIDVARDANASPPVTTVAPCTSGPKITRSLTFTPPETEKNASLPR